VRFGIGGGSSLNAVPIYTTSLANTARRTCRPPASAAVTTDPNGESGQQGFHIEIYWESVAPSRSGQLGAAGAARSRLAFRGWLQLQQLDRSCPMTTPCRGATQIWFRTLDARRSLTGLGHISTT
jgi:hypothetical protein